MRIVTKKVSELQPGDIYIAGQERKVDEEHVLPPMDTVYQVGPTHRHCKSEDYGFPPGYLLVTRHKSNTSSSYSFYHPEDTVEVWVSSNNLERDYRTARAVFIDHMSWQLLPATYMRDLGNYVVFMRELRATIAKRKQELRYAA